jgi:hypothetical protein
MTGIRKARFAVRFVQRARPCVAGRMGPLAETRMQ